MKRFLLIFIPIILVFNLSLSAFASDDDDHDDDFDTYSWLASQGYLPTTDMSFVEVYRQTFNAIDHPELIPQWNSWSDLYDQGSISLDKYINESNKLLTSSGVDLDSFYNSILQNINNSIGYYTVPTFPASRFSRIYQENSNGLNFITNVINNQKLTLVWSNSDWGYDNYLGGASSDLSSCNFINKRNNLNISTINQVYKGYYSFSRVGSGGVYVADICSENGDTISFSLPPNAGSVNYVSYEYGSYCKMLIYNDQNFSTVPVFASYNNYLNFMSGTNTFYQLEYLKSLGLEDLKNIDYHKLQISMKNALDSADFLNATELQAILNGSLLTYLEQMGLDIKEILLTMQSGLFDDQGNPYLKNIDDKMTIIINNLGNGGSYNDLELQAKLDIIIALLGMPDIDVDIDNPDFDDLKSISLTKFPFSVPTDILLLVSVLGVEPEKPDLEIGFPLMGSDEVYTTSINLDWFDAVQPYWFAFCDIGYCIFLLMLSLKIIEGVKD